jgi:drug/metabolite transporter (DMT)-like permease
MQAPEPPARNRPLLIAGAIVAIEGAALVVVSLVYGLSVRDEGHGLSAWGAAAVGVACGALVAGILARTLGRASRSAIAPALLLQLICLGEAFNMAQESLWAYAAVVAVLALAALTATGLGLRHLPSPDETP